MAAIWALTVFWIVVPDATTADEAVTDALDGVTATVLLTVLLAIVTLGLPATSSQAVFGWVLVERSTDVATSRAPISVNMGTPIRPLLVPVRHSAFTRSVMVVFDLAWSPTWRLAVAALVVGAAGAGAVLVHGAPTAVATIYSVAAVVAVGLAVVVGVREYRTTVADRARLARTAVRNARNERKRVARRAALTRLLADDPAAFDRSVLVEVDREVAKRVHLVRRIRNGQADAADILVGNVIHALVGTVDDATVRPLVLERATAG
ncbi:hypothetical protein HD599_002118 [Conyzicola lurida]|uniref:Uncharacterized protein n=1 Tax=Conyzicola lurida TaxID=1172621 RepID=A0A841AQE0_9MICO|nr:hypothetical protein [Conyzicola lurida]MBB5843795.1 hypothetical protein [Conyzicola lurida]